MSEEIQEAGGYAGPGHGEFCWTEIASNDAAKCMEFYSNVFGWKFTVSQATDGFAYHEYTTGGGYPTGGLYQITPEMCPDGETLPPPHFMTYIAVDSVDESATLAAELGGTIIKAPDNIPNTGRFAIIADPTGAMFSLFTMDATASGGQHG